MKIKNSGIYLLLAMLLAFTVGYASNGPQTKPPPGEKGNVSFDVNANVVGDNARDVYPPKPLLAQVEESPGNKYIAQADPAPTTTPAPDPTPAPTESSGLSKTDSGVLDVAKELGVDVNPNATPAEVSKQITDAYGFFPGKGSPPGAWVKFILACLGAAGTVFYAVKRIFFHKKE